MVDQSQRKAAEEEVRYLAYNDPLTGLPNRRLLLDRLEQALAMSARHQLCGAVMMLDLDNFKTINETQGPDMGDRLLREVARRLRDCVPEDETLARHGGDEFVVVLKDLGADPQEAANRAEEMGQTILAAIRAPFDIDGQQHHTALSVGIAIFRGVRESADELLKRSDLAMYEAKAAGRDTLRFFDPQMQAAVSERAALEADLRAGLDAGQTGCGTVRTVLPAQGGPRPHHGRRGTGTLAPSGQGLHLASGIHSLGGRKRTDPARGRVGDAQRLRTAGAVERAPRAG